MKQFARKVFHGGAMCSGVYDVAGRRKYLTADEGLAFIDATQKVAVERIFCEFLYYTGCRVSEALALSTSDFDKAEKVVLIETLKKRGRRVIRRIPIPSHLVAALARSDGSSPEKKIWSFSRTSGWRMVKEAMAEAGIQGIHATPKGLRHGFGVRSVLAKVPVTTIQRWMGHSSLETTAIYLDARDAEERELMSRTWNLNEEQA